MTILRRIGKWATPAAMFIAAFTLAGTVVAAVNSAPSVSDEPHDDREADLEPYRIVNEALTGDLWVLEKATSANDQWSSVTVVVTSSGGPSGHAIVDSTGALVQIGESITMLTRDDLFVHVDRAYDKAQIVDRSLFARDRGHQREWASHEIEHGNYAARLPAESPSGWDSLDLALAPSYWIRTMIDRMATTVTVIGDEDIAGRTAHVVSISFGGPAATEYGTGGWTWWVDAETGIILKYELGSSNETVDPFVFEIASLELSGEVPRSIELPEGIGTSVVFVEDESSRQVELGPWETGVDARAAIGLAKESN